MGEKWFFIFLSVVAISISSYYIVDRYFDYKVQVAKTEQVEVEK